MFSLNTFNQPLAHVNQWVAGELRRPLPPRSNCPLPTTKCLRRATPLCLGAKVHGMGKLHALYMCLCPPMASILSFKIRPQILWPSFHEEVASLLPSPNLGQSVTAQRRKEDVHVWLPLGGPRCRIRSLSSCDHYAGEATCGCSGGQAHGVQPSRHPCMGTSYGNEPAWILQTHHLPPDHWVTSSSAVSNRQIPPSASVILAHI